MNDEETTEPTPGPEEMKEDDGKAGTGVFVHT